MRTTKDDRETFKELASAFVADARELRVLREELKGLERVSAAAPLTGVAELVSDPNGEAVLWSDVLALLEGDE